MPKYFNQSELVIITIILLLLDFNGFCNIIMVHVPHGGKNIATIVVFFAIILTILMDLLMLHYVANTTYDDNVVFSVGASNKDDKKIKRSNYTYQLAEIVVINYLALAILFIMGSCVLSNVFLRKSNKNYSGIMALLLYLVPLGIITTGFVYYANFILVDKLLTVA